MPYVNYPSTEYLRLPFVDFVCFNVYLEDRDRLDSYLARLQNLAGDRPLVMAEIGLDSRRHGDHQQGATLAWQLATVFGAGCAGAFVFAWTDEWHRGGHDIDDWDFGLTDRQRRPKPALEAVGAAFTRVPCPPDRGWPRVSVVVCSYNGARTIRDCFAGLQAVDYPNFEVIVVDDGSTDGTADIAREFGFPVISTPNRGLSSARNTGLAAASGEIVAYIDDDAYPDPDWLTYLTHTFLVTDAAGVGGPNLPPPGDGPIADCVANAPGGPVHVLLSDQEAEHIPGCNMAFRVACLRAIGGFDPQFWAAGDDVDICWQLQARGWKLAFSPAALVWHHRRNSVRAYWKQQAGYGKAEALLERKWPEKYNELGHATWAGRVYGRGLAALLPWHRERVYHGQWGTAPFQTMHHPEPGLLASLPLMPEWYLALLMLASLTAMGTLWRPLCLAAAPLFLAVGLTMWQPIANARQATLVSPPRSRGKRAGLRALTALLYLLQPMARLKGRIQHGLVPWRKTSLRRLRLPLPARAAIWSERWRAPEEWLQAIAQALRATGVRVRSGGEFDRWDIEVAIGPLGATRLHTTVEEHGAGRQLIRLRVWPRWPACGLITVALLTLLSRWAAMDEDWVPCVVLVAASALVACWWVLDYAQSVNAVERALRQVRAETGAGDAGASAAGGQGPEVERARARRQPAQHAAFQHAPPVRTPG